MPLMLFITAVTTSWGDITDQISKLGLLFDFFFPNFFFFFNAFQGHSNYPILRVPSSLQTVLTLAYQKAPWEVSKSLFVLASGQS